MFSQQNTMVNLRAPPPIPADSAPAEPVRQLHPNQHIENVAHEPSTWCRRRIGATHQWQRQPGMLSAGGELPLPDDNGPLSHASRPICLRVPQLQAIAFFYWFGLSEEYGRTVPELFTRGLIDH